MKKMKKSWGLILAPVAVIAICLSLIAGSTFALFTSEDKVDITVSAGTVAVSAKVENETVKSPVSITMYENKEYTVSEEFETSKHASADFADGVLTVENLLAGDVVSFDLVINNAGDKANVQYAIECKTGLELMRAFDITIDEEEIGTFKKYTSAWDEMSKGDTTVSVTMALPVDNESANGKSAEIAVTVFAVQENVTFENNEAVIEEIPEGTIVAEVEELVNAMENGGEIVLDTDFEYTADIVTVDNKQMRKVDIENDLTIDLNGKTLSGATSLDAKNATLTIKNGMLDIDAMKANNGLTAVYIEPGSTLNMENVTFASNAYGVYVGGDLANGVKGVVNIKDCVMNCSIAAVGTNASGNRCPVEVNMEGVDISSEYCGILFNVPGTLNIEDCNITAVDQAILARGGDITVKNSTLTTTCEYEMAHNLKDYAEQWATGTVTNSGALVLGNKNNTSYKYTTTVNLEGVTLKGSNEAPAIYMWSHNDYDCKLNYDDATVIDGGFVKGGDRSYINGTLYAPEDNA